MPFTIIWFVFWIISGFDSFWSTVEPSDPHSWNFLYGTLFLCLTLDVIHRAIKKKKGD